MQEKNEKSQWRQATPGKKKFKIHICSKDWKKIAPKGGQLKLRTPWTQIVYKEFRKKNPSCPIAFKYQRVRCPHSQKHGPYMRLKAVCTFSDCKAKYVFTCNKPAQQNRKITISVTQFGHIRHAKEEQKFRRASYTRRGKIAKAIKIGISNFYYRKLSSTSTEELMAGNISKCLTKNVLKTISSEFKRSKRFHDNVVMELMITQKILRECDT